MKADYNENYLLQCIAAGDVKAFEKIYLTYRPVLASFIFKLCPSAEVTEEVVQDVFIKIWANRNQLAHVHSFKAYLFVAARHQALNVLRKMVTERNRMIAFRQEASLALATDNSQPDLYSALEEAIDQLPPQQKKVYLLCRREHMGHQDVASYLGLSAHTVKKYMKLAVLGIKKHLLLKHKSESLRYIFLLWMLH